MNPEHDNFVNQTRHVESMAEVGQNLVRRKEQQQKKKKEDRKKRNHKDIEQQREEELLHLDEEEDETKSPDTPHIDFHA